MQHEGGDELGGGVDEEVGGVAQHPAPRGVDDVAAGEAVVDPGAGGRADRGLHDIDERRHVVVGDGLAITHGLHERLVDDRRLLTARGCVGGGHDTERGVGLGGEQLDLQVAVEAADIAEDRSHLGERVAGDHDRLTL